MILAEGDGELAVSAGTPPSSRAEISMGRFDVESAEWACCVWPEIQMTIAATTSIGLKSRKNRRIVSFMVLRIRRRRSWILSAGPPGQASDFLLYPIFGFR